MDAPGDVTLGEVVRRLQDVDKKLDKFLDDHENRLRKVERWIYALPPTFIVACAGLAATILGN